MVYDSPDDESIPVVRAMQKDYPELRGILNDKGRGVINALRAGVEGCESDIVLVFAADEVGPVLSIEAMIELMNRGCDFVTCTRYAHGGRRLGGSLIGMTLSRLANWSFRIASGCTMTDATTGIKMFRRDVFRRLDLQANPVGWAVAFEMAIKAQQLKLRIGEVPIISIDRLYGGTSSFRVFSWSREYLRWFFWGVKSLRSSGRPAPVVTIEQCGDGKVPIR